MTATEWVGLSAEARSRADRVSTWFGAIGLFIAVLVMIGWMLDVPALTSLWTGDVGMKLNAAVCLVVLVVALLADRRVVDWVSAVVVLVLAGGAALEHVFGFDPGVSELLIEDVDAGPNLPGRMAAATSASLLVLGATIFLRHRVRSLWIDVAALSVLAFSLVAFLGHIYDLPALYGARSHSTIAIPTTAGLAAVSIAVLARIEGGMVPWVLHGEDTGALLMRQLLPVSLLVLPALGYARIVAEELGVIDPTFGAALQTTTSVIAVLVVTAVAARAVARFDRHRLTALEQVHALNVELLEQLGTLTGGMEERGRVAADLNDRVLQRIFAAGMHIRGAARRSGETAFAEHSPHLLAELDEVIKDLRTTIQLLTRTAQDDDLRAGLLVLAKQAELRLGFAPEVRVEGDVHHVPRHIRQSLLAVADEALSNVIEHAGATAATLSVAVIDHLVRLEVGDDGVGINHHPPPTGTGISDIRRRAQALGGSAEWVVDPAPSPFDSPGRIGTTLVWQVPL